MCSSFILNFIFLESSDLDLLKKKNNQKTNKKKNNHVLSIGLNINVIDIYWLNWYISSRKSKNNKPIVFSKVNTQYLSLMSIR